MKILMGLTGNGWMTLLNPIMFARINENTLHVFGAVNFLTIPIVWAFYPETSGRTLEEMDHLFISNRPFVWDEEDEFAKWKEDISKGAGEGIAADIASSPEVKLELLE